MEAGEGHGSERIGSLTSKIVNSLRVVDSIPSEPPPNSGITGLAKRVRPESNSTGRQRGGTNVVTTPTRSPSVWQTDQAIRAALPSPVNSWLRANEVTELLTGADGQFEDAVLIGYGGAELSGLGGRLVAEALEVFETEALPASRQQLMPLIADLWEGTSHAQSSAVDLKLKFAGYCAMLQEYPADVAREAIERWDHREKWWPARNELRAECDRLNNWRAVTVRALA